MPGIGVRSFTFSKVWLLTRCCMSLQVSEGLACKARAQIPAAMGALAEVPVCDEVQIRSGLRSPSWSTVVMLASWLGVPVGKNNHVMTRRKFISKLNHLVVEGVLFCPASEVQDSAFKHELENIFLHPNGFIAWRFSN